MSPEIAEAVASAQEAAEGAGPADGEAPPENGILGAAIAQQKAPEGAAAQIELGQTGSEPRLQLGGPEITDTRIGQLSVSVRTGPNTGMPSVAFKLELQGKKPESGPHPVTVAVTDSALAPEQMGAIPDEVSKIIPSLKGSKLQYQTVDGALQGDFGVALSPKADERMGSLMAAASDAFTTVLLPFPKEPVGVGGFWLVTAREKLGLGEVVGYHLVKVESIEGRRATLSVDTKRYLVTSEFQGLPAVKFLGVATTDLVVMPGQRLPIEGRTQQTTQALVQREDGSARPIVFELRSLFSFPPKEAPTDAPANSVAP